MIQQLTPARAKHVSDKKLATIWDDASWVAEEKMNGWRFLMHFGGDLERPHMTGRRTSSVTEEFSEKGACVPCLWPYSDAAMLGYTVIDGEVMPPEGASFHDIAGIMNVDPDSAEARIREIGKPRYRAFDILFHDGKDVRDQSYLERQYLLADLMPVLGNKLITMVTRGAASRVVFDDVVSKGGEGVILKNIFAPYGESGAWVKVKKFVTLDTVVMGFTDAREGKTGKYLGQIGAVIVGVYLTDGSLCEVGQASGMDDATRLEMTANQSRWIGTVVEVVAQEFGRERLLHPRFERQRVDANTRECTYEKMMRDLGTPVKRVVSGPQLPLFG